MRNAIKYKNLWLAQGSDAHELYTLAQQATGPAKTAATQKFEQHLKEVLARADALERFG